MQESVAYTLLVLAALALASVQFNCYVDRRHKEKAIEGDLSDGETARWVVFGVAYTCIGAAVLVGIWIDYMPITPWGLALATLGVFFAAFIASGLPMYLGDVNRSHSTRKNGNRMAVLDEAERIVNGE